ncbi:MAG: OmpA family protein [Deltaproteobacteria bacterium]|jgi:peptidoglycan-associated lipoprotein|nr:OmpA family protein [Deltaproteobacteria bacterium]
MKKLLMLAAVLALALPLAGCPKPVTPATSGESAEEALRRAFVNEHVLFDFDRSNIRSDQVSVVQAKAAYLNQVNINAELQGYADERGTVAYNMALSDRRAKSVKNYLGTLGIAGSRLTTTAYGESNPVSSGTTEYDYQLNRRVEFVIR